MESVVGRRERGIGSTCHELGIPTARSVVACWLMQGKRVRYRNVNQAAARIVLEEKVSLSRMTPFSRLRLSSPIPILGHSSPCLFLSMKGSEADDPNALDNVFDTSIA